MTKEEAAELVLGGRPTAAPPTYDMANSLADCLSRKTMSPQEVLDYVNDWSEYLDALKFLGVRSPFPSLGIFELQWNLSRIEEMAKQAKEVLEDD